MDRGGADTCVHCFSQGSRDEVVIQPNKCPSKDEPIGCFTHSGHVAAAVVRRTTFLVYQKRILTSWHGHQGGLITKPLETDRDLTKARNMTNHGK
jgi:hypothetical protein